MFVMKMVGVLYVLIFIFDLIVVAATNSASGATTFFLVVFFLAILVVLLIISRKPQNRCVASTLKRKMKKAKLIHVLFPFIFWTEKPYSS